MREDIQKLVESYWQEWRTYVEPDRSASIALYDYIKGLPREGSPRFVVNNLAQTDTSQSSGEAEFQFVSVFSGNNQRLMAKVLPANDAAVSAMGTSDAVCMVVGIEALDKVPSHMTPEVAAERLKARAFADSHVFESEAFSESLGIKRPEVVNFEGGFVVLTNRGTLGDPTETFTVVEGESKKFLLATQVRFGHIFSGPLGSMENFEGLAPKTKAFIATRLIQDAAASEKRGVCLNDISLASVYFSSRGDPVIRSYTVGPPGNRFVPPSSLMILAPEQVLDLVRRRNLVQTIEADSYGVGTLIYRLLVSNEENGGPANPSVLEKVSPGHKTTAAALYEYNPVPSLLQHQTLPPWDKIIAVMLETEPSRRPTAAQVLTYFRDELL